MSQEEISAIVKVFGGFCAIALVFMYVHLCIVHSRLKKKMKDLFPITKDLLIEYIELETVGEVEDFRKKYKHNDRLLGLADKIDNMREVLQPRDKPVEGINIKRVGWDEFCDTGRE